MYRGDRPRRSFALNYKRSTFWDHSGLGGVGVSRRFEGKSQWQKPAAVKTACIEILRKVDGISSAKAPGDATAFKNWLRQISQSVAEASTEGGFLGIGGVAVSDAEKATMAEISTVLNLPG